MKKLIAFLLAAVLWNSVFAASVRTAFAASNNTQSTSYTYTYDVSDRINISQDAYIPREEFLDLSLYGAQDMFVLGKMMYIADTGNRRVLSVDLDTNEVKVIGEDVLTEPRGISADANGRIYVADSGAEKAFRFAGDGELEFTFERPTTPNFGKTERFIPVKIAPSGDGGVYIVSEGNTAGIIYINGRGDFLGYYASNNVELSLTQKIMNTVLTEEQRARFLKVRPMSYGHIFRSEDGLIYTANKGDSVSIKKHSISGLDMLGGTYKVSDVGDICVTGDGRMIAVENGSGRVIEMQSDGYILCRFGGLSGLDERVGLFVSPTGIGVDSDNLLYVLDGTRNFVQVFEPTNNQLQMYEAIRLYKDGEYRESQALLQEMLKYNNKSFIGHLHMAWNYMQLANYEKAAEHYKTANIQSGYSDAYWEIRNDWLQNNLSYVFIIILLLLVVRHIIKLIDKRRGILGFMGTFKRKLTSVNLVRDISQLRYVISHPIDNAYNVHVGVTGSYAVGFIIYAALYVILIFSQIGMGFIYSTPIERFSIVNMTIYSVVIMGSFIVANYYITSINDGNGTLKDIFLCVAYGFAPVVLFMPFVILFANVATLNEAFIINISAGFLIMWSVVNIFVSLLEVHEYSFKEMVFSLLVTFFFMLVAVLAGTIFYMLLKQIYEFVYEVITEVALRV